MTFLRRLDRAGLSLLLRLPPRLALAAAAAEGRLGHRLGRLGPAPRDVAAFFSLSVEAALPVAREIAATALRNRALRGLVRRRGPRLLDPRLDLCGHEALASRIAAGGPAILFVAPRGPRLAALAALRALAANEVLLIANVPGSVYRLRGMEVRRPGRDALRGAAALKAGLKRLRSGGLVVMALEGESGSGLLELAFLGGSIAARRGVALLARLASAPVFPAAAAWRAGGRIELEIDPPVEAGAGADPDAADRKLLARLVRRQEELTAALPGQCDPWFLRARLGHRRPRRGRGDAAGVGARG